MRITLVLKIISLLCIKLMFSTEVIAQTCNSEFVTESPTIILVSPSEGDDTVNLQCAMDQAVNKKIAKVKLEAGEFSISAIEVTGFEGELAGTTRASTIITIFGEEIDCIAEVAQGKVPAGMRFIGGDVRIRFMRIEAEEFCSSRQGAIIHFTGQPATEDCMAEVMFGEVDRVDIKGVGVDAHGFRFSGILVGSQGFLLETCSDPFSGTFKLNRSSITNFYSGIKTTMNGQSPVDIRFSEFTDNEFGVVIDEAFQDTSIINNTFIISRLNILFPAAIRFSKRRDESPRFDVARISNNRFVAASGGTAVEIDQREPLADMDILINGNTFDLSTAPFGLLIKTDGVDGGVVTGNRFIGNGELVGLSMNSNTRVEPIHGWTIVDNRFNGAEIYMSKRTTGNIIGPNQNASIQDIGDGNIILQ